ncbi:hypothetical protein [Rhodococcoides kyotonense]|uniref:Uncharacterized protein n=1 Tax=Rhodococcoides kyotonense TaxID=398843 RepID=A0A239G0F7_9NOCA|nr:hypothetical protein [Rhodococcus kyotonensis]SNS62777.1 hypothetical protein SAMN05421642_1047 [Rhodococcus kyotonensis]
MTPDTTPAKNKNLVDAFLESPLSGLAPWITMSLVVGPGRFEEAASIALGMSVLFLALGHRQEWSQRNEKDRRGGRVKKLEIFDVAYFAIIAGIGLFAGDRVISWMELWSGEMTNIALAVFAFATLALRNPFTLEYAKEQTPQEYWNSPLFLKVNNRITLAWASAFAFSAVVGLIGIVALHTSDNFWTGWILQIGALLFALNFTEWYPDVAPQKAAMAAGETTEPPLPLIKLFDWIPAFVGIVGAALLITESGPTYVGIALVAAGLAGFAAVRRLSRRSVTQP